MAKESFISKLTRMFKKNNEVNDTIDNSALQINPESPEEKLANLQQQLKEADGKIVELNESLKNSYTEEQNEELTKLFERKAALLQDINATLNKIAGIDNPEFEEVNSEVIDFENSSNEFLRYTNLKRKSILGNVCLISNGIEKVNDNPVDLDTDIGVFVDTEENPNVERENQYKICEEIFGLDRREIITLNVMLGLYDTEESGKYLDEVSVKNVFEHEYEGISKILNFYEENNSDAIEAGPEASNERIIEILKEYGKEEDEAAELVSIFNTCFMDYTGDGISSSFAKALFYLKDFKDMRQEFANYEANIGEKFRNPLDDIDFSLPYLFAFASSYLTAKKLYQDTYGNVEGWSK